MSACKLARTCHMSLIPTYLRTRLKYTHWPGMGTVRTCRWGDSRAMLGGLCETSLTLIVRPLPEMLQKMATHRIK